MGHEQDNYFPPLDQTMTRKVGSPFNGTRSATISRAAMALAISLFAWASTAVEFGGHDSLKWLDPSDVNIYYEIKKMKWWDVCIAWGREYRKPQLTRRGKVLLEYLGSERMVSPPDMTHVHDRTLEIGMTECGMFASKGMPERANHTKNAAGTFTQYVYPGMRYLVYTEPSREYSVGVVRAIQH